MQQGQPVLSRGEIREIYHIETYQDFVWYNGEEQCDETAQQAIEDGSGRTTEDVNTDTASEATEASTDESVAAT